MRALKVLTIVMGVAIVVATAALGVLIARRLSTSGKPPPAFSVVLREGAGTRIAGLGSMQDRIALWLQGGGPDRILVIDPRSGDVTGKVTIEPGP